MGFGKNERLTLGNLLPPLFILIVICTIWSVYLGLHLLPMLQLGVSAEEKDYEAHRHGWIQSGISQVFVAMLIICYWKAVTVHPGTVPSDAEWLTGTEASSDANAQTQETKTSGERRFCKWCQKYKPDRCHHCRFCKACILKMDHHCPWIMNCVGFGNHKYFFLTVIYSSLNCIFICFTMYSSVQRSVNEETPPNTRFLLVLGLILAIIMGFLVSSFLIFHSWLALRGLTTIEFCEKSLSASGSSLSKKSATYDRGMMQNINAVLGPNPLLWFLPMSLPEGDGLYFKAEGEPSKTKNYSTMDSSDTEPEITGERRAGI